MEATLILLSISRFSFVLKWCASTLGRRRSQGFSKTARFGGLCRAEARPHRCQLDAVRRYHGSVAGAVLGRRLADDFVKGAAERAEAGKPHVHAHVGDAAF